MIHNQALPKVPAGTTKKLIWRAAVIGLTLHTAVVLLSAIAEAPSATRAAVFIGAALGSALVWICIRPIHDEGIVSWRRMTVEAIMIGLPGALFAVLLGWAAAREIAASDAIGKAPHSAHDASSPMMQVAAANVAQNAGADGRSLRPVPCATTCRL